MNQSRTVSVLILIGFILCLLGFLYIGYTIYPKINKQPEVKADTVLIYDTVIHVLPGDLQLIPSDTITHIDTLYHDVDTAAILADYNKQYQYNLQHNDSNIIIDQSTIVSMNRIKSNNLTYKWLQPVHIVQNITDNSISYASYVSAGLSIPFKDPKMVQIQANFTNKIGSFGMGYQPFNQSFNINLQYSIIHIRGRGGSK
jgi:hypothetical protein